MANSAAADHRSPHDAPPRRAPAQEEPEDPRPAPTLIEQFGELFSDVQTSCVLGDGKTFVDAVPRQDPRRILALYRSQRTAAGFSLGDFVARHFELPQRLQEDEATALGRPGVEEHIRSMWPRLARQASVRETARAGATLLELPHPYVVPGGRFDEIYYWDSYFTMLGLVDHGHAALAESMVRNFASLIDRYGHVPNGNRSYYLSRSQPPFFFKMVECLAPSDSGPLLARFLPQLKAEHRYWMRGADALRPGEAAGRAVRLRDGRVLNRYWDDRDDPREESFREDLLTAQASDRDPRQVWRDLRAAAESGWDFSSRWCADPTRLSTIETTSLLPVDLNCLLHGLERAIAAGCAHVGDLAGAHAFERRAANRLEAIDRCFWSADAGHYVDYHWVHETPRLALTAATAMPLFMGLASPVQADRVARALETALLTRHGLVTTAVRSGQQWDYPIGWAPLQWIAIDGLRRYGHQTLAQTISTRWIACVDKVYRDTGRLVEKYDLIEDRPGGGGEYDAQCGFGWTNGVMVKLLKGI
jgi:alpha,alpha-trehalase